jgi:hypothetical protein
MNFVDVSNLSWRIVGLLKMSMSGDAGGAGTIRVGMHPFIFILTITVNKFCLRGFWLKITSSLNSLPSLSQTLFLLFLALGQQHSVLLLFKLSAAIIQDSN